MEQQYNMDFLISALVLLILIFCHFISDRKLSTHKNRVFLSYMLLGIADIILDIATTVLISMHSPSLQNLTTALLTVFYMLQVIVSTCLAFYVQSLRNISRDMLERFLLVFALPVALMMVIIITNIFTGALFTVNSTGVYIYGPQYSLMYIYAILCMLYILGNVIINHKDFSGRQIIITIELIMITTICVFFQMLYPKVSLTGVAIALIITVLLFTLHNPYNYTDNLTGLYDIQLFSDYIGYLKAYGRRYHIISVYIPNISYVNSIMGVDMSTRIIKTTASRLVAGAGTDYVFHIERSRFAVIAHTLREYEYVLSQINDYVRNVGSREMAHTGMNIIFSGIMDAQRLETSAATISYVEYLETIAHVTSGAAIIQSDTETLHGFRYNEEVSSYLKKAIEEDLFDVSFQPMYSLDEKCFVSMEALSRLHHPMLGFISPDVFIQIAERNGDIARIGYLQFRRVCRFVSEHRNELKNIKNIKINLSPAEFLVPGHSKKLCAVMEEFGIEPEFFQFEITETVATRYGDKLIKSLEEFRKDGVGFCMDDFGAGYANLNAVMKIPFSTVKLDRSLLSGAKDNPKIRIFYKNISSILKDMGFYVVAEGVENEEELAFINECSVNCVQGFYFSKALDIEKTLALLKDNNRNK